MTSRFPFGRPATRRPPRGAASGTAELLVLGVYPSALHVRWNRGDVTIGALAVDDEPTVFWDGADAAGRIEEWKNAVGWRPDWGTVGAAGGNGSSGRHVVDHVLTPLGVAAGDVYFTDCLPTYFVKSGPGSQAAAIRERYEPFARTQRPRLPEADLRARPAAKDFVRRAVAEEGEELRRQFAEAQAPTVVTLGQEAADVLAGIARADEVVLTAGDGYGSARSVHVGGVEMRWLPLVHPGNSHEAWRRAHQKWVRTVGG
jgi:hypothetical protein